ncbi:hypothetical protein CC79DRAFT_1272832 [Sarocladium strictum]
MTAPSAQQVVPVKDSAAIRKRRRRAPAGGASDDCFTCSKRNVKCDRRRPYCSQCLEVGNECSGYKTQLTWNVGVASRGKLRGLSLPVAKAPPVPREPKRSPARSRAHTASISAPQRWVDGESSVPVAPCQPIDIPSVAVASAPTTPYGAAGFDYLSIGSHDHHPSIHQHSWGAVSAFSAGGMVHSPDVTPKYSRFPFPLVTDNLSSSMGSVGSVTSDVDYMSPVSQSYPREEIPFMHSPTIMYDGFPASQGSPIAHSPPSGPTVDYTRAPTSCPSLVYAPSETSSSLHSQIDVFETHLNQKLMHEADHFSASEPTGTLWSQHAHQQHVEDGRNENPTLLSPVSEHPTPTWPTMMDSETPQVRQDLAARMPFFLDYYNNTLCPSMVFIDGPGNPFRDQILTLANDSSSLRHAICALAACNLRMKRKLSLGQDTRELFEKIVAEKLAADSTGSNEQLDQAVAEEYQHRNMAIQLLNEQLNDPSTSGHDSVLATILLLCHYRMAESGVAKFHTQFAGVKKLLALAQAQKRPLASEPTWLESLFTYFDAISASINDREAQLVSPALTAEMPLLHTGVENLVGCDSDLFRIISKLGRLNLLFQRRPVQSPATTPDASNRFDGNGFGTLLNDDELQASAVDDGHQSMFWREWKAARLALQNWQFDSAKIASRLPGAPSPGHIRDLESLSEAFRYAGLLYTERLACPTVTSQHNNVQNLVSQVVYYATSLENGSQAEKFLLWPLFVAGSECVNELQQRIVRTKCRDITSRSGYMNNLAALDVLEKIWAGQSQEHESRNAGTRPSPLNWDRCIGGPSIDVEWIMF